MVPEGLSHCYRRWSLVPLASDVTQLQLLFLQPEVLISPLESPALKVWIPFPDCPQMGRSRRYGRFLSPPHGPSIFQVTEKVTWWERYSNEQDVQ